MRRFYSTIMMLAMMVAALALTACGGSSSDDVGIDEGDYGGNTSMSLHLNSAGTLSSMISKSQASELLRLKLSGHIDARDFDFIKWDCMKIREVDLSEVVIDSYKGVEGTQEGENVSYAANEVPSGAFFYWSNVHKYVYDGMPVDEGMASLRKIILPKGIKAIRRNAFARAYNLTEINIPEGVEAIDYVAFAICTSLEELRLPSSLKTVGQQAFADMTSIKRLYVSATTPPTASSNSFQGIPKDAVLYVPSGKENLYRNAVGWNYFSNVVGIDGDINQGDNNQGNNTSQGENQTIRQLIVGTWKDVKENKGGIMLPELTLGISYIRFNNDGTWFSVLINDEKGFKTVSKGKWHVYGDSLIVNTKVGGWTFYPIAWAVKNVGANELILSFEKATAYLNKVSDSEIEKHLPSDFNRTFYIKGGYDCLSNNTLTINGQTYYASRWSTVSESANLLSLTISPNETITSWSPSTKVPELKLEIGGGFVHNQNIGEAVNPCFKMSLGDYYPIDEGSVTILEITDYYLTIGLNQVKIHYGNKEHVFDGVVVLFNSGRDWPTLVPLPFEKPNG